MTLGGFVLGSLIFAAGFFMIWRTNLLLQWFGDISQLFGSNMKWMSWKVLGLILIFAGFLLAFSLIDLFIAVTVGQLFG